MSVNIPIVNAPYLSVQGMEIVIVDDETLTIADGQARNSTNENDIALSASVTVSNLVNGINGLDTGTVAAATLYAVYVVGDSTLNNDAGGLLSLASNASPTLPSGYDMYRLVGYVRTDATSDNLLGYFSGSANERMFMYDAPISAGTTNASATYADIDLTDKVPLVDNLPVIMAYAFAPNADNDSFEMHGANSTGDAVTVFGSVAAKKVGANAIVMAQTKAAKPQISYKTAAAISSLVLSVVGYHYTI